MPSRTTAKTPDVSRDKLFWAIASAMVVGQLVAFWMLCSHQVRKAEVRDATAQVERMAVADCLRYIPGATLSSCAARIAPLDRGSARRDGRAAPGDAGQRRVAGRDQQHGAGELRLPLSEPSLRRRPRAAGFVFAPTLLRRDVRGRIAPDVRQGGGMHTD